MNINSFDSIQSPTVSVTPDATPRSGNLLIALIAILVGAPLTGALFEVITHKYKLVLFSAFIPALAAFAFMAFIVWASRIHSRIFAIILAVFFSIIAYGTYQIVRYTTFRNDAIQLIQKDIKVTDAVAGQQLDKALQAETGASGFIGYVKFSMKQGETITETSAPSSTSPMHVSDLGVLALWFGDALIIFLGAVSAAVWAQKRVTCDRCGAYYGRIMPNGDDTGITRIGWVQYPKGADFAKLAAAGQWEQVAQLLNKKRINKHDSMVGYERCTCNDDNKVVLWVYEKVKVRRKTVLRTDYRGVHTAEDFKRLTTQLAFPVRKVASISASWLLGMTVLTVIFAAAMYGIGIVEQSM